MNRFFPILLMACLLVLAGPAFTASPTPPTSTGSAVDPPICVEPTEGEEGGEHCTAINPFCVEDNPSVAGVVNDAIAALGGADNPAITNRMMRVGENRRCTPEEEAQSEAEADEDAKICVLDRNNNCGPGLIVELVVDRLLASGVNVRHFPKSSGAGTMACNGHAIDVIIFEDGCAFDIIAAAGAPNQHGAMQPICCGEPPCQTQGCCKNATAYPG